MKHFVFATYGDFSYRPHIDLYVKRVLVAKIETLGAYSVHALSSVLFNKFSWIVSLYKEDMQVISFGWKLDPNCLTNSV